MDVSFQCPHCGKSLRGRMRSQSRTLKCPKCQGEAKVTLSRPVSRPLPAMATPLGSSGRFAEMFRSARVPLMLGVAFAAGAFFAFSGSSPALTAGEVAGSASAESGSGPLSSAFFAERNPAADSGLTRFVESRTDGRLVRMPVLRPVSAGKDAASGDFSQMPQLQDGSPAAGKFSGKFDGDCAEFDAAAKAKAQEQCAAQDAASAKASFDAQCGDKSSKADFSFDAAGAGAGSGIVPGVRAKFSAGNGEPGNDGFKSGAEFKSGGCGAKKSQPQFKQSVKQPLRIPKSNDGNPSA